MIIPQVSPTDMGRARAQLFCRLVYDYRHDPTANPVPSSDTPEKDKHHKHNGVSILNLDKGPATRKFGWY